ncbi:hypothetical protein PsWM33_02948 [Pseudovibrio sp. WM33]|nr:hypothetical protein PsWM33_02948 [Pseudovibrio sp. WM33]
MLIVIPSQVTLVTMSSGVLEEMISSTAVKEMIICLAGPAQIALMVVLVLTLPSIVNQMQE